MQSAMEVVPEAGPRAIGREEMTAGPAVPRLLQALVLGTSPDSVRLMTEEGPVLAKMALGYTYRAVEGDLLLVIGQGEAWYVIGVIHGMGRAEFVFPGGVDLGAPCGRVRMQAAGGVSVQGPEFTVHADRIQFMAGTLVEKAKDAYRWVKGLLQTRAGNRHTAVEGDSFEKADRIYVRAAKEVNMDGKTIQLG